MTIRSCIILELHVARNIRCRTNIKLDCDSSIVYIYNVFILTYLIINYELTSRKVLIGLREEINLYLDKTFLFQNGFHCILPERHLYTHVIISKHKNLEQKMIQRKIVSPSLSSIFLFHLVFYVFPWE